MSKIEGVKLRGDPIWIKDEKSWRMFYVFEDNNEVIKIELLNFTCRRDVDFLNLDYFKTENLYNQLLYKLKALCDRPDTIKDLFDIYFIVQELGCLNISNVIKDLNDKFEEALCFRYEREDLVKALRHELKWDIQIGEHVKYLHGLRLQISQFQEALKHSSENEKILDFNFISNLEKKARGYGLNSSEYIDIIEDNQSVVWRFSTLNTL